MYNIIKRCFLILLTLILISGCTKSSVKIKTKVKSYETENEIVYIERPVISGLKNDEFQENLNKEYEKSYDEVLKSFLEASEKTVDERNKKSELVIKQRVSYNKNGIISVISERYQYTDGLNGQSIRNVNNIDAKNNKKLMLCDIFCDGEYKQMLNQKLEKIALGEMYSDIWEKPQIGGSQNEYFYFTNKGLVIFYPPYELSYYSRGFVEFTIPYDDLYGYLKPEFSKLKT